MNNCCDKPRKTVSVSTRKGRRVICNSCGAPWVADSVSSALSSNAETTQTTPTNPSEWMIDFGRKLDELGMKDPRLALEIATHVQTLLHHNTEDIIDRAIYEVEQIHGSPLVNLAIFHAVGKLRALKPTHKE